MYALVNGRCDLLLIIWSKFQQMHLLFISWCFYKHIKTCFFLIIFSLFIYNFFPLVSIFKLINYSFGTFFFFTNEEYISRC